MKTIEVRTFAGWQWSDTGDSAWDFVPEPFRADVMEKTETWSDEPVSTLQGIVTEDGHELNGFAVLLSQRHVEWDGHVNVTLRSSEGRELRGFGSIDLDSFNG